MHPEITGKRRRMFHMWMELTEPVAQVEETPAAEDTTGSCCNSISTSSFSVDEI
jgi:hypothetical protein